MDSMRMPFDRRSGKERRQIYNRGYFRYGGDERRSGKERRCGTERRKDWVKTSKWSSAWQEFAPVEHRSSMKERQ